MLLHNKRAGYTLSECHRPRSARALQLIIRLLRIIKAPLGACIDRLRVRTYVRTPQFGELVRESRETCVFVCLSVLRHRVLHKFKF